MKSRFLFILAGLLVMAAFSVNAQEGGFTGQGTDQPGSAQGTTQGGFRGPSIATTTVAQAKKLKDDAPVILRGRILRFLGDEKYEFSDNIGTIIIEIDDDVWRGL